MSPGKLDNFPDVSQSPAHYVLKGMECVECVVCSQWGDKDGIRTLKWRSVSLEDSSSCTQLIMLKATEMAV